MIGQVAIVCEANTVGRIHIERLRLGRFGAASGWITDMADADVTERHVSEVATLDEDTTPRAGRITFRWDDDTETALTAVLNLLFFHQMIPEMPEVKILGRDEL